MCICAQERDNRDNYKERKKNGTFTNTCTKIESHCFTYYLIKIVKTIYQWLNLRSNILDDGEEHQANGE